MKKTAAVLALVLFASPVLAEEMTTQGGHEGHHRPGPGHFLKKVDADKDGKVSKAEFTAQGDKMFGEADANKDGYITAEEMKAAHAARKAKWEAKRAEWKAKQAQEGGKAE